MSYDLNLYLKKAPSLTAEAFARACNEIGLTGQLAPDFAADCTLSPLCAKIDGLLSDERTYLAVVDCTVDTIQTDQIFTLPVLRRRLFEKKSAAPTLTAPCGSYRLTFCCGIDSLELPFSLLLASALAEEEGLLYDCVQGTLALGSDIAQLARQELNKLRATPADRLYLHEFEEWI